MKKLMIAACAVAMACAAEATADIDYYQTQFWFTPYADRDANPSENHASWYKCYVLDQSDAQSMLKSSSTVSYSDVATWLGANFSQAVTGSEGLSKYGSIVESDFYNSGLGVYDAETDAEGYSEEQAFADAIGVVIFENGGDYAYVTLSNNNADYYQFQDWNSYSESSGWTAASVPEPTSGLLLLLGMAGLALKRKRVVG